MDAINNIKSVVEKANGIVFRKPVGGCVVDAVIDFPYGDDGIKAAASEFEALCSRVAEIGERIKGSFEGRDGGLNATYLVGDLRIWITVTGGDYSGARLGVTARPAH